METGNITTPGANNTNSARDAAHDLELWKHFASTGAADKNTMIGVVSWLLTFTATIVGIAITQLNTNRFLTMVKAIAALGICVSGLAAYVALVYAGYTNRNWEHADAIASRNGWQDLLGKSLTCRNRPTKLAALSNMLAAHRDPKTELAPIFTICAGLAMGACLVLIGFLVWSLTR